MKHDCPPNISKSFIKNFYTRDLDFYNNIFSLFYLKLDCSLHIKILEIFSNNLRDFHDKKDFLNHISWGSQKLFTKIMKDIVSVDFSSLLTEEEENGIPNIALNPLIVSTETLSNVNFFTQFFLLLSERTSIINIIVIFN